MRLFLRWFLNAAIVAGLAMAVWPLGQNVYGRWSQQQLQSRFERQKGAESVSKNAVRSSATPAAKSSQSKKEPPKKPSAETRDSEVTPRLISAQEKNRRAASKSQKWPLTRLEIPDIGLTTFVVQGWDSAALRRGPGHDPNSSLPGEGNCAIAGHRNTYGSFFYRLDELLPGAPIIIENREGRFVYAVERLFSTPDTDVTILKPPPAGEAPVLTLVTCTLPHTSNRIVLQARLIEE